MAKRKTSPQAAQKGRTSATARAPDVQAKPAHGTQSAGDKADKPGTDALQRLLVFLSDDKSEIFGQNATLGQYGAKAAHAADAARKALEYLEARNAEHSVWHAMRAMEIYGNIRHLADEDDMKHLAEWWKTDTEPAVIEYITRVMARQRKAAEFKAKVDDATDRLAALLNSNSRMSYTGKVKKAAKDAGISWRKFWDEMPAYLKTPR